LNKYAFGNANQDNLWDELTKQAYNDSKLDHSLNITSIMNTWTLKKGYPVVSIVRNYSENLMTLRQEWFLLNPLNKVSVTELRNYKWFIPFTYTTQSELSFELESNVTWFEPEYTERNLNYERLKTIGLKINN
jgi:aminopeptidase N